MEVDFAFLADGADAANGKIYVVGGAFDTIWSEKVPFKHAKLSFVLRLVLDPAELDRKHRLEVCLIDEDGKNVSRVGGDLEVKGDRKGYAGWNKSFLTVLHFVNLEFPRFGDYAFKILFNNSTCKMVPLRIAQAASINPRVA